MAKTKGREPLTLYRLIVSKARFRLIPRPERLLFLRFGYVLDEINTLLRLFLYSSNGMVSAKISKEEMNAKVAQGLVVAKILTGKLFEAYRLIRKHYYGEKIAKDYEPFLDRVARDCLKNLDTYFCKDNLIRDVRNIFGFHYAMNKMEEAFQRVPPEDDLVFYFGGDSRNTLFCSADVIARDAMLECIRPGCPYDAEKRLHEETTKVTGWLTTFFTWFLYTVMTRYLQEELKKFREDPVTIPDPPLEDEIELPYFISFSPV